MNYYVPLWKHQIEAIERAKDKKDFALFFEMGTGKTATAINLLRHKCVANKRFLRALILCPPIVIGNWEREFKVHAPLLAPVGLRGSQTKRCNDMHTKTIFRDGVCYSAALITNYEALLMKDLMTLIKKWGPEVLILDEAHKVKDPKSKRAKFCYELSEIARYRFLLTGTPVLNSPMDLFSQFKILDHGETFGRNFFTFRSTYFWDKNAGMPKQKYFPNWQVKPGALEDINKRISAKSMRITKAECLDLPPLVVEDYYIDLSPQQQKLYNSMKQEFVAFMNDRACIATLAITKALRLMQIVSGFVNVEGESGNDNIAFEDNPRAEALSELLQEITPHSKVLVWAVFKENYKTIRAICETLKLNFVEVHGEISATQKQANVDRFNSDSNCRVLIGHPGSGGIGINLVAASYSIFYSRNFSLEQDLQAEARNHRGGSEIHAKITRINLIARDTIDELVSNALAAKIVVGETILKKMVHEL